ncbi:MAG: T9SS type A sorting domain-containing protein [Bacteroidales bacterium]|jgi:hypothetical protein|nr:T9SS type A sorting domain-containing protein [Bacteroidales bacterium]
MKKIFTLLFLFSVTFAFGQTLKIYYNGTQLNNGDTVYLAAISPGSDNIYDFDIQNTSEDTVRLRFKKEEVRLLDGSVNSFCFYECLSGNETNVYPIAGGQTLSRNNGSPYYFYTMYTPNGNGTSIIKYSAINTQSFSDQTTFTAIYTSGTGISQTKTEVTSFNAYPNPAETQVTIKYNMKGNSVGQMNLIIKNIMGQTILTKPVSGKSNAITVDVSGLPAGLYLYSLEADCAILLTKKLYVK